MNLSNLLLLAVQPFLYHKLTRVDANTSTTSNYTYNYYNSNGSNQLQSITGLAGSDSYTYDVNGNVQHDGRTGRDITYNYMNLPQTVNAGSNTITYTADGEKLKMVSSNSSIGTIQYDKGIVYDKGDVYALTEEGRVLNPQSTPNYEYNLSDHLGNTRVTFDSTTGANSPKQADDYYPFGMTMTENPIPSNPNKYLYNKKELQQELNQYDYGARFYDPVIARFSRIDRFAEKYYGMSTYQ